jgi:hypothetical protein
MTLDTLRQDEGTCSLTVDGRALPFVFSKRSGGKVGSEGSKTFPGAMRPQKAHGGSATIEDVTLEGEFVPSRDNEQIQWLKTRAGKGAAGVVENGLDVDGNVIATLNRWTGVLASVDPGDYDASSSTPRMFAIDVEADGSPA